MAASLQPSRHHAQAARVDRAHARRSDPARNRCADGAGRHPDRRRPPAAPLLDWHGQGPIAVVFQAGGGAALDAWGDVPARAAARTVATVVAYDRAGMGQSEVGPIDLTPEAELDQLGRALDQLGLRRIVLVGHSFGGLLSLVQGNPGAGAGRRLGPGRPDERRVHPCHRAPLAPPHRARHHQPDHRAGHGDLPDHSHLSRSGRAGHRGGGENRGAGGGDHGRHSLVGVGTRPIATRGRATRPWPSGPHRASSWSPRTPATTCRPPIRI